MSRGPALDPWTIGNKQMTTSFKIIPQPGTVAARGKLNLTFKFAGPTGAPAVRREAEEYWGNGVVLTRLPGIHTDGHAPSLEAAKAEFQASWRQWLAWAKLGEVQ